MPRLATWSSRPLTAAARAVRPRRSGRASLSATARLGLMDTTGFTQDQLTVREAVGRVCARFPNSYWRQREAEQRDPGDFHAALAGDGWLGIALPTALGGAGLGISEATVMMQTIAESGAGMAGAQAVHANVYATQPLARFDAANPALAEVVAGRSRVCFGVTEPGAGLNTAATATTAVRVRDGSGSGSGPGWRISGQKVWITCAQVAAKMLLLARTTAGLSLFCIDLDRGRPGLAMRRMAKMGGRAVDASEVFLDDYAVPASALVGAEGRGFDMLLHGLNAERCLLAGEALGLGYAALGRAAAYARERVVFGRPVGANQGVAHPLADAWMRLEAAKLATYHAAGLYDEAESESESGSESGSESESEARRARRSAVGVAANTAKYLAAEAAFAACERALLAHGGMGYAVEYDVERWFRESMVPRIAPVSREMILNYVGERVLKLPRSY